MKDFKAQIKQNMVGKTCLITGSSRGIGLYTALGLARLGAHVIIVSHNRERSKRARDQVAEMAGADLVNYYVADLSSMAQVQELANKIKNDYAHLDILINNVAGWFRNFQTNSNGIEMTFALNHLSYFLLTGLLLDLLKDGTSSRIINVSSDAHKTMKGMQFSDIEFREKYNAFSAYAQSKLANLMFTYELSERLEGTDITVNALHPGFVNSELYRDFGVLTPIIKLIAQVFGKSSAEGAETPIYLASSPKVATVNGKYFEDKTQIQSSDASYDRESWKRLWELSEEMTDFSYPF
jgi:NAD(P)-dependent dehydrogenase (short-subunit alcohol dehydrogenase family)